MLYLLFLFSRSMSSRMSNLGYKIVLQSPRFPTLEASDIVVLSIDAVHLKGEGSRFDLWAFGGMSPTGVQDLSALIWLFLIKIHELRESLPHKSVAHFFQPALWIMSRHLLRIGSWPRTHSCPLSPEQLAEFSFCFHLASETLQWAHHSCPLWVWLWTLVKPFLIGFSVYLSLLSPHGEGGNRALHTSILIPLPAWAPSVQPSFLSIMLGHQSHTELFSKSRSVTEHLPSAHAQLHT